MAGNKSRDGIRLSNIIYAAKDIGVETREGSNHRYILNYERLRPCPVESSTDVRKMVVLWFKQMCNYDTNTIYSALRNGYW